VLLKLLDILKSVDFDWNVQDRDGLTSVMNAIRYCGCSGKNAVLMKLLNMLNQFNYDWSLEQTGNYSCNEKGIKMTAPIMAIRFCRNDAIAFLFTLYEMLITTDYEKRMIGKDIKIIKEVFDIGLYKHVLCFLYKIKLKK